MNLLQKQGFFNSIILNAGTALGFVNIILFQRVLDLDQIGFFNLVIAITVLYGLFSSMGLSNIILRYFPYFSTSDKKHRGFITFVCWFSFLSFIACTAVYVLFKGPVVGHYQEKQGSSYLIQYYYHLIPLAFFILAFTVVEAIARAVFKNVLSAFLREIFLRLSTTLSIGLIMFGWFDYYDFILTYILTNGLIVLILWYSLYKDGDFKLSTISHEVLSRRREMTSYGFFALLSGGSITLIQYLDTLMLSSMKNDALVGIYATFFSIAVVVSLPAKALNRTSYQIVSNAWAANDLQKIGRIYHKTSVVQFLIGCLLLIGLIINKENILVLLKKPEFRGHFDVFVLVAFAFLADITGGLNSHIISSSKYYKFITFSLAVGVVFCISINFFLIPPLGMIGAAISYLLTIVGLNFVYWLFIKVRFGLQPFDSSHLKIIIISGIVLSIGLLIPYISNFFLDVPIRSSIIAVIYISLIYFFKISPDVNQMIQAVLVKLKIVRPQ